MNAGLLILLGVFLVGVGVYNFMRRDHVWDGQVRVNEMRGLTSERTDSWDMAQSLRAVMAIVLGVIALGGGLIAASVPQPPSGHYSCLKGSIYDERKALVLSSNGQGTYDGQPLTWTNVGGVTKKVTFAGDIGIVSGEFPPTNAVKMFVVTLSNGETQQCFLQ